MTRKEADEEIKRILKFLKSPARKGEEDLVFQLQAFEVHDEIKFLAYSPDLEVRIAEKSNGWNFETLKLDWEALYVQQHEDLPNVI